MTIPRYILHPFLLLLSGGTLLWLIWTGFPTFLEMEMKSATERTALPDPAKMVRLKGVTADGILQLEDDNGPWRLWDERFRDMTAEQTRRINELFAGKLISLPTTDDNSVRLPIEFYDPLCFKGAPPWGAACPIVLEP